MVLAGEGFRAVLALKRSFAGMLPYMVDQMLLTCKRLTTIPASVWRLARMLTYVIKKMFFSGEGFAAEVTAMWCCTCMPHDVVSEVLFSREGFPTHLTTEWRVIGVGAHVIRQVLLSRILLTANAARVRSFTCTNQAYVENSSLLKYYLIS